MMRALVSTSVRFRLLAVGLAGALLMVGATQLGSARVDVLPEFQPTYVEVQTEALGLSAEEVEELVTVPQEADLLHGVAFLKEIRSQSIQGLSSIVLVFEPGTDMFKARQVVAERLTQAHALPNVASAPVMLQPLSSLNRFMIVSLSSAEQSLIDMSVLARWNIQPRLMGVPGVANVAIYGQRERQLQVLVDPARMRQQGVTLEHVVETAGNSLWFSPLTFLEASTPGTGGFIDTPNQRLGIQHILPISSAEDLAKVTIDRGDGAPPLKLGDVANVVEDHQPLIGDGLVGNGTGLMLVIEKFPGVNTLDVTRNVESALTAMKPGLPGITIDTTVFREASFIDASIGNVSLAVLIGFLLIAVILGAMLFDWRAALISLVTIPLGIVAAALVLHFGGASLNAITLVGLLIAMSVVIDDVVSLVDGVLQRLRKPLEGDAAKGRAVVVTEAVLDGRGPVVYATLIILVALVPLLFISGAVSAFLPSLAVAYGVAVVASLIVSLTVAPALAVLLLSAAPGDRRESPLLRRVRSAYQASVSSFLRRTRPILVAGGVVVVTAAVVAGVVLAPANADMGLPTFRQRDLLIHWNGAPGVSHPEMTRIVSRASAELRAIPGIRNVGAHIGRAIMSDQQSSVNAGEIWVSMDPAADYDSTLTAVEATVAGYPGLERTVTTYPTDRIESVLGQTGRDVSVRVYGQDLAILQAKADEVRTAISDVSGVDSPAITAPITEPTIEIEVDLAAAGEVGLKPGDIRRAAASLLSGILVGNLFEDQKVFEVVVWGTADHRASVSSVADLLIDTPDSGLVRLGDVADVRVQPSPSVIDREGVMRYVDVTADVKGRDLGSVIQDVKFVVAGMAFDIEYHAEVNSPALVRQDAQNRLLAVLAGGAILVLLLLQAAFGAWRLALLVLLSLPAAAVGGVVAALVTGNLMTLGALAGLITVVAITIRHAVALVDRFRRLEVAGEVPGLELALTGVQQRLAPIVTTVLATAAFALPFIALGNVAGLEIMRPMAVFVLGGLVSSVLLLLFVLPSIYMLSGPSPESETESLLSEPPAFEPTAGIGASI
jgi:Cu/Ag efflux pump CusA